MSNRTRTHPVPFLDGGVGFAAGLDMVDDDAVLFCPQRRRRPASTARKRDPTARGRGADAPRATHGAADLGSDTAGRFDIIVRRQRRRSLSAPQPVRPAGVRAEGVSENDRPRPGVPGESMNKPAPHSR